MRISAIQMAPGADKAENIAQARRLIAQAVTADRPDIIALPEIWTCLGGDRATKFAAAETLPAPGSTEPVGAAYGFLREMAQTHGIHIHGGSIGEAGGERLFNTNLVFAPDGQEIARYRKIHLFDITTPDGQGYRESAVYGAGDQVVTARIGDIRIGLSICYDVRFPELYRALREARADIIFIPAAFTLQTGKDHWEVLLRARAIETQCYVVAPACTGTHYDGSNEPRVTFGNSLIIDPWGAVIARASDGAGFTSARIDRALIARIRRDMPIMAHRVLGMAATPHRHSA